MWKRICPNCGKTVSVVHKISHERAIKLKKMCSVCSAQRAGQLQSSREKIGNANRGSKNGMYGKHAANYGKKDSPETLQKKRHAALGKRNGFYGHRHTEESKAKMRASQIESLQRRFGGGVCPTYNPKACEIIDEYARQNGYKFRHALNGGEFFIKELGYWVDGYDEERNAVIEYYEKSHRRTKEQARDERRITEIRNLLHCCVIILKEWDTQPTVTN